jgi:hypothetical protein
MSDLIRAHEGNPEDNPKYPSEVHWGKFNMIGKFISCTTQCQVQCRTTTDYNFTERPHIRDLVFSDKLMSTEACFCLSLHLRLLIFVDLGAEVSDSPPQ